MDALPERQRGLTLLELVITLCIVAILAGIAVPDFTSAIKRNNSTTIAYALMGIVQYARTEAVSKGTPVTLCGSTNGTQCDKNWSTNILVFVDHNGNGAVDTGDTILQIASPLKTGETLAWHVFGNKPYLQMQPYGMTYYQNGNFTYCPADRDAHYAVHWILNTTGHLRIADDKNGNGIPEDASGQDISC
jgi:type IV fimbrial biogenesis protein FimT